MRYQSAVDFAAVEAIDMHVHYETDTCGHHSMPQEYLDASAAYFKGVERIPSIETIADSYRELNMAAVIFTIDART